MLTQWQREEWRNAERNGGWESEDVSNVNKPTYTRCAHTVTVEGSDPFLRTFHTCSTDVGYGNIIGSRCLCACNCNLICTVFSAEFIDVCHRKGGSTDP